MKCRNPAVAGLFYPDNAHELSTQVNLCLQDADEHTPVSEARLNFKALIVPHAGYIYSGSIAASAYRLLKCSTAVFTRVLLLGPSHRVGFHGIATPEADAFNTPLGNIPLDRDALAELENLPFVSRREDAHLAEHSLEVQLPFLQMLLSNFELIPLVVGDASPKQVQQVLEQQWTENTLTVISTDLSHFHRYQDAMKIDQQTNQAILDKNYHLEGEQACGCRPLNGLLKYCSEHHLKVDLLDLRNSGDTAGDKNRVVGYGAYVVQ